MKQDVILVDDFYDGQKEWDQIMALDVEPVKDPTGGGYPVKDLQDIKEEIFIKTAVTTYYGTVTDATSGEPLAGATVRFYNGGQLVNQVLTDNKGYFSAGVQGIAESVTISMVGYETANFSNPEYLHSFPLQQDVKNLDPVLLPPGGSTKKNIWPWLILAGVAYAVTRD